MSFNLDTLFQANTWQHIIQNYFLGSNMIINILDIIVVWYLLYKLIMLIRGTKAIQLLKGIAIILIVRIFSGWLGLNTVSWLMNQVITYGVIAVIIIFQPEVRRGLEHLGRSSFFNKSSDRKSYQEKLVLDLEKAIQYMSKRKIGALITIERNNSLEEYIATGILLDADISSELLINIFIPNTPLHDGAVIIKGEKIAASCAYLPLSEDEYLPKEFGTRHRAALGISEASDSVTIVVSEETGDVSIAYKGHLHPHLTTEEYIELLSNQLIVEETKESYWQQFLDGFKGGRK